MSDCRKTHSKEHCSDYTQTLDNQLKVPPRDNYPVKDRAQQRIFELELQLQSTREHLQALNDEFIASREELHRANIANIEYERQIQELRELNTELDNTLLEQERRNSELNRFFHLSPDMLCIAGLDGYFKQINFSFTRILGYSTQELLAQPFIAFVHPDDVEATLLEVQKLAAGHDTVGFENRYRCRDGSYLWLRWTATSYQGQIYAIAHDLTEQKLAQELKVRLLAAIETASDGIAILHENKFIYLNQAHLEIYGYSNPEELMGQSWEVLYNPEEIAQIKGQAFPLLDERGKWQGITKAKHRSGHTFDAEVTLSITPKGDLICICRDISERAQTEQLEEANRAKDAFIAHVSHELRTPLTSILGFSNLLQRDSQLNSQQLHYVDIVHDSGRQLLNLINDVLDISKITADKLQLEPKNFNLIQFLNEIVTVFLLRTTQKGLKFETKISESLPAIVNADETKLRQVLYNLLTNAIKFTETGGVTLKVDYVENLAAISTAGGNRARTPQKIRFQIEDTGIGIPANKFTQIFTPFGQLNGRVKQYEGTGLGLTISQNIIRLMGSQIQLESEVNRGSKFWFDLELLAFENNLVVKSSELTRRTSQCLRVPRKVLVIDDNDDNRDLIVNYLQPLGFILEEAKNGEDGLKIASKFQPDAILVDLIMPVMNGTEMIAKIKQQPQFRDLVIIMISANSHLILKPSEIDCHGFLSKPVNLEQLRKLLDRHLHLDWQFCQSPTRQDDLERDPLISNV